MELTIMEQLAAPFPEKAIHWRVGARTKDKKKGIPLAYIDARDAMKRLDDVVGGENWQCRYPLADSGLLICEVGIRASVFGLDRNEWVWKANGAGDTQVEAEKGKASDAFKRACVLWKIGQYLYSMPNIWLPLNEYGNGFIEPPRLPDPFKPEYYEHFIQSKRTKEQQA
jgi:hypothetical protein